MADDPSVDPAQSAARADSPAQSAARADSPARPAARADTGEPAIAAPRGGLPALTVLPALPAWPTPVRALADDLSTLRRNGAGAVIVLVALAAVTPAGGALLAEAAMRENVLKAGAFVGAVALAALLAAALLACAWQLSRRMMGTARTDVGFRRRLVCAYLDALDRAAFGGRSRMLPRP